ncbi:ribonuclease P protein subunit p20-like isoform X1 [Halichondria panicea]|uniref:ribonuclease P protein subunit p20-like isoform X1 n=1 Tax=Halichondria panicea TaxID=6063 RepID=UPI00312BB577
MDKVKVNKGTKVPVDQTKQRPGSAKKPSHSRRKRPPKRLSQRPNDVYINRSSQFAGQLSRCKRIFDQGFQEVTVHGLGAAIHRAINLSLQLRENYTLSTHTTTSTVQLVDDLEPLTDVYETEGLRSFWQNHLFLEGLASSTISKLLSEYQQSLNIIIVM